MNKQLTISDIQRRELAGKTKLVLVSTQTGFGRYRAALAKVLIEGDGVARVNVNVYSHLK